MSTIPPADVVHSGNGEHKPISMMSDRELMEFIATTLLEHTGRLSRVEARVEGAVNEAREAKVAAMELVNLLVERLAKEKS